MTLYTNIKNPSSSLAKIIPIDAIGRIRPNDGIVFCNRESTRSQSHLPNKSVLEAVHSQLKCKHSFEALWHKCTAYGSVGIAKGNKYFTWLGLVLRAGLATLGAKGTLYAVFITQGRLFRPPGYKKDGVLTWNATQADYDAFDNWLYRYLGSDAGRIVFAIVFDGDGTKDRNIESIIGTNYKTLQAVKAKPNKRDRDRLHREAIRLSASGLNAGEILRRFERMLEPSIPHIGTVRDWAKQAGTSKDCGRRKMTKCQSNSHYMESRVDAHYRLIPLFSEDKSNMGFGGGYIHILPISTSVTTPTTNSNIDGIYVLDKALCITDSIIPSIPVPNDVVMELEEAMLPRLDE